MEHPWPETRLLRFNSKTPKCIPVTRNNELRSACDSQEISGFPTEMLREPARADETVIYTASISGLPVSYAGTRAGIPDNQATHYEVLHSEPRFCRL